MNSQPRHFAVIGAGIVGVSTALYLQRDGHRVSLIDHRPPGEGASMGNAAVIAAGACEPVAMPGILWRGVARRAKRLLRGCRLLDGAPGRGNQ